MHEDIARVAAELNGKKEQGKKSLASQLRGKKEAKTEVREKKYGSEKKMASRGRKKQVLRKEVDRGGKKTGPRWSRLANIVNILLFNLTRIHEAEVYKDLGRA